MFNKKYPSCLGVAALTVLGAPSLIGSIVKLALNSDKIVKAAGKVKEAIDNATIMATELANQQITPQEVVEVEVASEEVN